MPTVASYLDEWLSMYANLHCKLSTYLGYKQAVEKHLIPTFGRYQLHALPREMVKKLIADLVRLGKARGTIQNCLVPLKAAYNQALEDGLVTFNPAGRLGRLLRGRQDRRVHIQPLTPEEVETLLQTASQHTGISLVGAVQYGQDCIWGN